jgi:hypothetical protein
MNNVIDITPRLRASRLSTLHNNCVNSDNALKGINEALRKLNKKIDRIVERER